MNTLQILAEKNVITKKQAALIEKEAEEKGLSVEQVAVSKGIPASDMLAAKGDYYGLPVADLSGQSVSYDVLQYIPEESASYYKMVPIAVRDGVLEVGIIDPDNIEARDALSFISSKTNLPFKMFLILEDDYRKVMASYKGLSGEVDKQLDTIDSVRETEKTAAGEGDERLDDETFSDKLDSKIIADAPIAKIGGTILRYAIDGGASDIHIEPMRETTRVRFRVDGTLNTSLVLPKHVQMQIASYFKLKCGMRIDERRKPQDGRFSATMETRKVDFRVSTFPTYFGEKIVMRILDQAKGVKPLAEMGITERNAALLREAIKRPYGLILISGPTGSGKTTTLYSLLSEVDRDTKNVLSLEDPIEYNIEGVNQSQVRPEIGYTFANGLRTTLRQDPNVILVGEIRDKETAQLAVQAALTGHLVLSTIHTNNAIGVIPRLVDMGVDPYLIAPTLILAIAQRLVSRIAPGTGRPIPVDGSVKAMIDKQFEDLPEEFKKDIPFAKEVLGIAPTPDSPLGVRGRAAVFEILKMDKDIERIILKEPTDIELWKTARSKGMITMKEDAIIKAFQKEIPFEEVSKL